MPHSSQASPLIARRVGSMEAALHAWHSLSARSDLFWSACERDGLTERDTFWDWYIRQPATIAAKAALDCARAHVESVFMTPPLNAADESAVCGALDAYAQIAASAFAMQTARDFFMPVRYLRVSPQLQASLREMLLGDPDEAFKVDLPWFFVLLRQCHRQGQTPPDMAECALARVARAATTGRIRSTGRRSRSYNRFSIRLAAGWWCR